MLGSLQRREPEAAREVRRLGWAYPAGPQYLTKEVSASENRKLQPQPRREALRSRRGCSRAVYSQPIGKGESQNHCRGRSQTEARTHREDC